ncbi:hypothetical protein ZIOFF_073381 [Zingiber officinale]|uniref:GRAM domain-containing protein n=1 Tax=Zingiber officinale TaxID=94328 RepID=A0A8J5EMD3_ZINOF|nr:hypothetical protein ZIOFF_073381 [Zingiber officinale]
MRRAREDKAPRCEREREAVVALALLRAEMAEAEREADGSGVDSGVCTPPQQEDLAGNFWQHLKTGPSITDAAMGRIAQTTKVISEGGYEKVFHQTFEILPGEKLKKSYTCYLSTSSGPVMGVLYLSTANLAFCSDNPLSYKVGDQTQWSYYKISCHSVDSLVLPPMLGELTAVTKLDLHSNGLTGKIPPELGKLKNLVELRLDRNRLEGQIPGVTMPNFSATLHTMSIKPIQKDEDVCITYIDLLEPKVLSAVIGDVRGQGLMLGVELVTDRKEKMPTKAETVVLFEKLKDLGVLLGKGGLQGNVFGIKPPMCFTKEDAVILRDYGI